MAAALIGIAWGVVSGLLAAVVVIRTDAAVRINNPSPGKRFVLACGMMAALSVSFFGMVLIRDNYLESPPQAGDTSFADWHLLGLLIVMVPTLVKVFRDNGWLGWRR